MKVSVVVVTSRSKGVTMVFADTGCFLCVLDIYPRKLGASEPPTVVFPPSLHKFCK